MRVLGIDPSAKATGFGIVEDRDGRYVPVCFGSIKPSPDFAFHFKLDEIRSDLDKIIAEYAPAEVAIESPFYAKNVKTALALGQVRGACLIAVASRRCALFEYSALEIKKAVSGYGQADKTQVMSMVRALLGIDDPTLDADAADALAAAVCHLNGRAFRARLKESEGRQGPS
ncbi:MAG: crossover junction endodeoxyribonuclease RuvC [Candidatus Aminicenantes bacterium]|nr:crossover junction endodeoxyribonuclease RuvC [Candidatus Aminicenantes bacterium]